MVLSSWPSTVAGFLVLVEVVCRLILELLELPTNGMSIDRKSVFMEHVYVVETQRMG